MVVIVVVVVSGFRHIFGSLGIPRCLSYMPYVVPCLIALAETDNSALRELCGNAPAGGDGEGYTHG